MRNSPIYIESWDRFRNHWNKKVPHLALEERHRAIVEPIVNCVFESKLEWWWINNSQIRFGIFKKVYLGHFKSSGVNQPRVTVGWNIKGGRAKNIPAKIAWLQPDNLDSAAPWDAHTTKAFITEISNFSRNHFSFRPIHNNATPETPVNGESSTDLLKSAASPNQQIGAVNTPNPFCPATIEEQERERRHTISDEFFRDRSIVQEVLRAADGRCAWCGKSAHFVKGDGQPFLQVHHIVELSSDGADAFQNCVALHADCHAEAHYASLDRREEMKVALQQYRIDHPR